MRPEEHEATAGAAALRAWLQHVYWIGGGSGASKSTIARRIAAQHSLQVYSTDEVMADHASRQHAGRRPAPEQVQDHGHGRALREPGPNAPRGPRIAPGDDSALSGTRILSSARQCVRGRSGCTGGLLSGSSNTCYCFCRDLKSAATVGADEVARPADSLGRVAAWADPSADGLTGLPSTRAFTGRRGDWPGIGYAGGSTVMGACNRLCAHSQLRLGRLD